MVTTTAAGTRTDRSDTTPRASGRGDQGGRLRAARSFFGAASAGRGQGAPAGPSTVSVVIAEVGVAATLPVITNDAGGKPRVS